MRFELSTLMLFELYKFMDLSCTNSNEFELQKAHQFELNKLINWS
jgi:hypothetical protein